MRFLLNRVVFCNPVMRSLPLYLRYSFFSIFRVNATNIGFKTIVLDRTIAHNYYNVERLWITSGPEAFQIRTALTKNALASSRLVHPLVYARHGRELMG